MCRQKPNMQFNLIPNPENSNKIFRKTFKEPWFLGMSVLFCPYWGRNEFSQQIGLCQFLVFTIIMQKKHKSNGQLPGKTLNWQTGQLTENGNFMGSSVYGGPIITSSVICLVTV